MCVECKELSPADLAKLRASMAATPLLHRHLYAPANPQEDIRRACLFEYLVHEALLRPDTDLRAVLSRFSADIEANVVAGTSFQDPMGKRYRTVGTIGQIVYALGEKGSIMTFAGCVRPVLDMAASKLPWIDQSTMLAIIKRFCGSNVAQRFTDVLKAACEKSKVRVGNGIAHEIRAIWESDDLTGSQVYKDVLDKLGTFPPAPPSTYVLALPQNTTAEIPEPVVQVVPVVVSDPALRMRDILREALSDCPNHVVQVVDAVVHHYQKLASDTCIRLHEEMAEAADKHLSQMARLIKANEAKIDKQVAHSKAQLADVETAFTAHIRYLQGRLADVEAAHKRYKDEVEQAEEREAKRRKTSISEILCVLEQLDASERIDLGADMVTKN
jgi:hypothetical protein